MRVLVDETELRGLAMPSVEDLVACAERLTHVPADAVARTAVKRALCAAGLGSLVRRFSVPGAVVLMFHKVHRSGPGLWGEPVVDLAALDSELAFLTRHFEVVSLRRLVNALRGGSPMPRNAVAVTFDDGYRNNLVLAGPLLRRHRVPATVFVTTGLVGSDAWMWGYEVEEMFFRYGPGLFARAARDPVIEALCSRGLPKHTAMMACVEYLKRVDDPRRVQLLGAVRRALPVAVDEENRFLSWDEVRALESEGVEIGGHTLTHPILPLLSGDKLVREVVRCRDVLEQQLGHRPSLFSYPNGDFSPAVVEVVRRSWEAAVSACPGRLGPATPLFAIPRLCAPASVADLAFELARLLLRDPKRGDAPPGYAAAEGDAVRVPAAAPAVVDVPPERVNVVLEGGPVLRG